MLTQRHLKSSLMFEKKIKSMNVQSNNPYQITWIVSAQPTVSYHDSQAVEDLVDWFTQLSKTFMIC